METLRIIAMFLVLVVHADFLSFGAPTRTQLFDEPLMSGLRVFVQSLSIICVNVFILISGWFSIRPSVKGATGFAFQCLYFMAGIYLVLLATGEATLSKPDIVASFGLRNSAMWFVFSYLGLYLFAPLLNLFSEKATERELRSFLILFFIFQAIFGASESAYYILHGYSQFSFMGLYLLARYLRMYCHDRYPIRLLAAVFMGCAVFNTAAYYFKGLAPYVFNYCSLPVIIEACALLLIFSQLKIRHNRFVNWVSASSFAVYLTHCHSLVLDRYLSLIRRVYYSCPNSGGGILLIIMTLAIVFLLSVLLDQPRKLLWRRLASRF